MEKLNELIEQKNKLVHEICELEFKEKGFEERLKDVNYKLFRKTPLGKNTKNYKLTIGITKKLFWKIIEEEGLIIIAVMNPRKVDSHIFYVYDHKKDSHFKNGYTDFDEYVNYMIVVKENGKDIRKWLKTMEEYLDEKEKKED
jgi:hypothetical protein